MDYVTFLITCVFWIGACGGIGYVIGEKKGLAGLGVVLGAALGPLGLIVLAILPSSEEDQINEPEVHYGLPEGIRRTGAYPDLENEPLPTPKVVAKPRMLKTPSAPRFFICDIGGEVRGPFDSEQIAKLRVKGTINDNTLFCLEGSQKWQHAPQTS